MTSSNINAKIFAKYVNSWLGWLSSVKHYQSHTVEAYKGDLANYIGCLTRYNEVDFKPSRATFRIWLSESMSLSALKQQLQGGFLLYEVLAVIVIAIRFLKIWI